MSFDTDVPPHKSAQPMDPPPTDAERPNMAMLKADIDSGRTGDKVAVFDPGMAMLGTCEEAAGTPLTPEQVAIARDYETKQRWRLGLHKAGDAYGSNMALYAFGGVYGPRRGRVRRRVLDSLRPAPSRRSRSLSTDRPSIGTGKPSSRLRWPSPTSSRAL